ncbi:RidA family protein [Paenibacillus sepulcri]|uniref:RidA family protein n=1 Tax=Paenibacillus sepulcri TaxID=359917 RepID=A0ABS7CI42_9BACL|nr:RidA family protein [Paenibacillus sepulcri]
MKKEIIYTNKAPDPAGSYSQAVKYGNMLYVAGTCPFELGSKQVKYPGDMARQTELVLEYMSHILESAGSSLDRVLKVTSFIDDLDRFSEYDKAYSRFFQSEPPVRSTIEIGKFPPGMCVEIECIAYIEE